MSSLHFNKEAAARKGRMLLAAPRIWLRSIEFAMVVAVGIKVLHSHLGDTQPLQQSKNIFHTVKVVLKSICCVAVVVAMTSRRRTSESDVTLANERLAVEAAVIAAAQCWHSLVVRTLMGKSALLNGPAFTLLPLMPRQSAFQVNEVVESSRLVRHCHRSPQALARCPEYLL